ncbi:lipocalin family protein [Pseudomonas rustica]|uniref:lipocalin family protein n=1 Tax=Pseudomonas rustica TaxID=2827099 RepID=UPI003CEDB766
MARLLMIFQRNCEQSKPQYGLGHDGRIDITNRCKEYDGHWNGVHGVAEAKEPGKTDKLRVRLVNGSFASRQI